MVCIYIIKILNNVNLISIRSLLSIPVDSVARLALMVLVIYVLVVEKQCQVVLMLMNLGLAQHQRYQNRSPVQISLLHANSA